jgi:[2Fe-2S] binding domain
MRLLHAGPVVLGGGNAARGGGGLAKLGDAPQVAAAGAQLTDEEIRERMSGNICRCGAYGNIVAAIMEAAS